jgi:hypothetical protein
MARPALDSTLDPLDFTRSCRIAKLEARPISPKSIICMAWKMLLRAEWITGMNGSFMVSSGR